MEGYLSSVKEMNIVNIIENIVNISEISSDNIGKLTSIVTDEVYINNMTPVSQLGAILASVQSEVLSLQNMSLSEEALVTAMRARVQSVLLWNNVTLDLELLAAYDGEGRCTRLELRGDTRAKYETRLRRWAGDKGWAVTEDDSPALSSLKSLWMQRI